MNVRIHTPSAGGVVIHDNNVLVITSSLRGSTDLPKGTIEQGESIEHAAVREVEEETGYRTRIIAPVDNVTYEFNIQGSRYQKTVTYFLMELADSGKPIKNLQPGEDFQNEWLSFDEALSQLTFENIKLILKKAIELL